MLSLDTMWRRLMVGLWIAVSCGCQVADGPLDASRSLDAPDDALDARARGDAPRLRVPRDAPDAWREPDASLNECWTSEECDDGIFCNGAEYCGVGEDRQRCYPGPPCPVCNEASRLCCEDHDGDGYFAPGCTEVSDCDDRVWIIHPGAVEVCNRTDEDCDGVADEGLGEEGSFMPDCDCDGAAGTAYSESWSCPPPWSLRPVTCMETVGCWSALHTDCDDDRSDVSPHLAESRCDGLDDDCDGRVDERGADVDGDGYYALDCGGEQDCLDVDPSVHPGAPEPCLGRDTNCDGRRPDADGDGHAALDAACDGGPLPRDDCDDTDARVRPDAREICNSVDDDCDGEVDGPSAYCYSPRAASTECRDGRCLHVVCATGWGACEVPFDCTIDIASEEHHCGACDSPCRSGGCRDGACRPFDALALATTGTYGLLGSRAVRLERSSAAAVNDPFMPATAIGGGARLCWGSVSVRCDGWPIEGRVADTRVISSSVGFACAVTSRAEAWCWGAGPSGELGDGALHPSAVSAVRVSGLVYATTITTGELFACAIDTHETEAVWCWGDGSLGTLGNGATGDSSVPVPIVLARPVLAIASGDRHACALARDGSVWCWGQNLRGQLGVPPVSDFTSTPREVVGMGPVVALAAAGQSTCALSAAGERWCWGANDAGQLGDGTRVDRAMPTLVEIGVRRLWLGPQHGCAETTEGTLRCWGENGDGRLGDGTTTDSLVPVVVDYAP